MTRKRWNDPAALLIGQARRASYTHADHKRNLIGTLAALEKARTPMSTGLSTNGRYWARIGARRDEISVKRTTRQVAVVKLAGRSSLLPVCNGHERTINGNLADHAGPLLRPEEAARRGSGGNDGSGADHGKRRSARR
jgi:hypothetical protein